MPVGDRLRLDPEHACGLHRSEDVLDVEAAAKLRLEGNAVDDESGAARGQLEVLGVRELERHRLLADVTELLGEPPAMRVPDVDDRRRPASIQVGLGEEPALGVVVVLERPVEVEVVLAQVREDEDREADPEQALQRGAVGGRLHGGASVARVEHLAQETLDVDRLGGRPDRGAPLAADPVLDGAEETGAPAGRGEDGEEEERRRRLPVRAGDADDLELARRVAEEGVGRESHRLAGILDDELRHRQRRARARRSVRRRRRRWPAVRSRARPPSSRGRRRREPPESRAVRRRPGR